MARYFGLILLSILLMIPASGLSQTPDAPEYIIGYATRDSNEYYFDKYHLVSSSFYIPPILDLSEIYPLEPPKWSPDGTQLAFIHRPIAYYSESGYYPQVISLVNASGIYQDTILQPKSFVRTVHWSPDGTQILFVSGPAIETTSDELEIVNVDGTNRQYLVEPDPRHIFIHALGWSPDSTQIVYLGKDFEANKLYLVNRDGSEHRVVDDDMKISDLSSYVYWTPNQQSIILLGRIPSSLHINLLKVNLISGEVTQLIETETSITGFDFAPDDQQIVVLDRDNILKIYDIATGEMILSTEIGIHYSEFGPPQWSPDGKCIAFSAIADDWTTPQIFVLEIETGQLVRSYAEPYAVYPYVASG